MNWNEIPQRRDEPDFGNLLAVLHREIPGRPTLFEFYMNDSLYRRVVPDREPADKIGRIRRTIQVFFRLGFDYATILVPGFEFADPTTDDGMSTFSLNEASFIRNRMDFESFAWPDPDEAEYDILTTLLRDLPEGMKLIPFSPFGVLENVINLVGYEPLCYLLNDDSRLAEDIFFEVGGRLLRYYERIVRYESVGACLANDDWGFKTGLLVSPEVLRQLVFPWYRRIVEVVHGAGKPVILHSCGYLEPVMGDIIDMMRIDGRHSFEDSILPVETAYDRYGGRIAILGGIDLDFLCRSSPAEVYHRSAAMLERSAKEGGYALGTGNSVPDYVPDENYFALLRAALNKR